MSDTNTLNDLLPDSLNQEEQPNTQQPSLTKDDEILDMSGGFDFDDYQVVRREFFAHIKEPSVTFNECKLYVNAACLSKFPNASYAQVLINQKKKILALRPCEEGARDSFMWCIGEYGEVNKAWTADDVKGFTKILGNQIKIFYNVQKRNKK